jgi:2-polyprenyl-3-methyl-5-hydroxy-6-metoxy-1,4-benzoquinol methylase
MYAASYYQNRWDYYFQNCVTNSAVTHENTNIRDFRKGLSLIEGYKGQGKLLDVGCALGAFLCLARERGWEVYGVDVSHYAASYGRETFGLDILVGQLEDAQFPDKFFDVITLWDVLEHFPDPSHQLKEIFRVLKDDGIVFLNAPNEEGLLRLLAGLIFRLSGGKVVYPVRKLYHPFHLYYFTQETLGALLQRNGFNLLKLERRCIPIIKARGRLLERFVVKLLSWPGRLTHREYELWAIAKKPDGSGWAENPMSRVPAHQGNGQ